MLEAECSEYPGQAGQSWDAWWVGCIKFIFMLE